ncbi:hypothetical protein BZL30_5373 [Mycobacterium kansasii]|uniref:Uncharacterized protein n=1 Tax=Mycobacterium kansasii TaxID=1768 RepID=A0A1V3WZE3_MYCKA|nr:hypothetical protein BZL30_5373 [Mycobacterium kansasii]
MGSDGRASRRCPATVTDQSPPSPVVPRRVSVPVALPDTAQSPPAALPEADRAAEPGLRCPRWCSAFGVQCQ